LFHLCHRSESVLTDKEVSNQNEYTIDERVDEGIGSRNTAQGRLRQKYVMSFKQGFVKMKIAVFWDGGSKDL
jgi:hypothetical protein